MIKQFYDSLNRLIMYSFSYIYRLNIVIAAIALIFTQKETFQINKWFYAFISILYFAIFFYLRSKKKEYAQVRSYIDLLFISSILYGENVDSIPFFLFYILPLVNYGNHTADRISIRKTILFLITWSFLYQLLCISFNKPFLLFSLFSFVVIITYRIRNYFNLLADYYEQSAVEYYENISVDENQVAFRVLQNLKDGLNKNHTMNINDIYCFEIVNNNILIRYATNFIVNYRISDRMETINRARSGKSISDIKINIEGKDWPSNFAMVIKFKETEYLYVFTLKGNNNYYHTMKLETLVSKALIFISRIVKFNIDIKMQTLELQQIYKENLSFINDVHNAMHFVKNQMSPLKGYLEVVDIYFENSRLDNNAEYNYIQREQERIKSIIHDIEEHSYYILGGSIDIVSMQQNQKFNYQKIISIIRDTWQKYFGSELQIVTSGFDKFDKLSIFEFQKNTYETLIDNLISNIFKYSIGENKILINFLTDKLICSFQNKTSNNNIRVLRDSLTAFNNDSKEEILKAKNHGLYQIQNICKTLGYNIKLRVDNSSKMIIFDLYIPITGGNHEKN